MLILGHAGIALGAATVLAGTLKSSRSRQSRKVSWFTALGSYLDIRLLLIGSLLPDIIDKPVGQYFFSETFSQGRIFAHMLLFLILITAVGFYLYKRHRRVWLLTLSIGTFIHLVMDQMWRDPATLFWPFLGVAFRRTDLTYWLPNVFVRLFSDPAVYVPELVGFIILLWFGIVLVRRRSVAAFIKRGQVR